MNDTTLPSNPRRRTRPTSLRPGFALHDWMNLLRHAKDLSGRRGAPIRHDITLAEVSRHSFPHDGWMVLHGKVYNIGPYLMYHPGGSEILQSSLGRDGTKMFEKFHAWVNVQGLIGPLLIGYLSKDERRRGDEDEEKMGEKFLRGNESCQEIVLPSAKVATTKTSRNEIEFAMPNPRPSKGQYIPSLLGKPDNDDDEENIEDGLL